jgi:hypothetical protein
MVSVAESLCEVIEEETGITVKPNNVGFNKTGEVLTVFLFGDEFTQVDVDDMDVEDWGYVIAESVPRIRERVTGNRILALEKNIKKIISEQAPGFLTDHSMRVENRGYMSRYRHYTTEEETERGYPDIILVVENSKEKEYEVDPYNVSEPVNLKEILE